jgi:hypothetical protein
MMAKDVPAQALIYMKTTCGLTYKGQPAVICSAEIT